MSQWFVDSALEALEEGYRCVAANINRVLTNNGIEHRISTHPLRQSDDFAKAQQQLRRALPGLRTLLDLPVHDNDVKPWTLGYINGEDNRPWDVSVDRADMESTLPIFAWMESLDWPAEEWQALIVAPVEGHMTGWREKIRSASQVAAQDDDANNPTSPQSSEA